MTEVAFHFNAPDKLPYACRLLRKACAAGARVVVTGQPDLLRELDTALWTFSSLEFLPHCLDASPASVQARTPIVLSETVTATPHRQVLVNLGARVPPGFEGFERLIEVVTGEPDDRQHARQRWKHYADRGYSIVRYDVAQAR